MAGAPTLLVFLLLTGRSFLVSLLISMSVTSKVKVPGAFVCLLSLGGELSVTALKVVPMLMTPKFLSPAQTPLLTSVANCLAVSTWTCSRCPVSSSSQGDLLTQQMGTYRGVLLRSLGPGPQTHWAVLAESFLPSGLSFLICEVRCETGLGMANGFHLEDRPGTR